MLQILLLQKESDKAMRNSGFFNGFVFDFLMEEPAVLCGVVPLYRHVVKVIFESDASQHTRHYNDLTKLH